MTIITVIPVNPETAPVAENLLDWIFQLNQREAHGAVLLLYDGVHDEAQTKIRTAASLAYTHVEELNAPARQEGQAHRGNILFLCAAEHCQKTYRIPWLYMDPTSVPTNRDWFRNICNAYAEQPMRYMGTHLKANAEAKDIFLFPFSVYHMGAFNDTSRAILDAPSVPFEFTAGPIIGPKSFRTRLIQPLKIIDESDFSKIWDTAQIVVGDITGALIEKYRGDGVHVPVPVIPVNPEWKDAQFDVQINPPNVVHVGPEPTTATGQPKKIDRRTREGKALAAAQKA